MGTRQHVCTLRGRPLQPASRRALRRQVSEPIGSGRSSRCEQSRRKAPGRAKAAWPLTRDTSAGSLVEAAGERAQARAPEGIRASHSNMTSRRRPAVGVGVLFRQDLGRGGKESSSNGSSRMRMSSRMGAGRGAGTSLEAQAIRSVVLVDCVDCRSRRAAPGLSPDGDGSSLFLVKGRTGVGSRIAVAKP